MDTTTQTAQRTVAEAIWSPSVHNTQPWLFSADGQHIRVYADLSRLLAVADPYGREMMISCGAAVFTIRLALRSLGLLGTVSALPDPVVPELIADVTWLPFADPTGYERLLAAQVRRRRSHRGGFDTEPLPRGLLTTAAYGAAAAPHSQPLELPWLRESLRTQLSDGAYPQIVLRFGMVTQVAASVRRNLADVLYDPHP